MAKKKDYTLKTLTDIKVFILFLLDTIRYPVDYTTLRSILFEHVSVLSTEYDECIGQLTDEGHIISDEVEGERYLMISDTGRRVAAPLYDSLDPVFREKSLACAAKHISLSKRGIRVEAQVRPDGERYMVTLSSSDAQGTIFHLELSVASLAEAQSIRKNFEAMPDSVYRGILFSATGRIGFLS